MAKTKPFASDIENIRKRAPGHRQGRGNRGLSC